MPSNEETIIVAFQYTDAQGHAHLRITYPWRENTRQLEAIRDMRLERTILEEEGLGLKRETIVAIKRAVNVWAADFADDTPQEG